MVRPLLSLALLVAVALACRGERVDAQRPDEIAHIVDSLRPAVERAAGLAFRTTPRSAMRSRDEVRAYLVAKLDEELPEARAEGLETAYRLFGLVPDTLQLRPLLLDLLTEQVVGYYDPDSAMLFGVRGTDPMQLRLVLAHEMVHALQGQYLPLDSILDQQGSSDRLAAAQAILEGQATLASLRVLAPDPSVLEQRDFWRMYREQIGTTQQRMPRFAAAPLVIREGLIFPYLEGAEFMRWWDAEHERGSVPYGPAMPLSSEQIIHPVRYARRDAPLRLRFTDSAAVVLQEDELGEMEIRVLATVLRGAQTADTGAARTVALGWGGDRYRVYDTPAGPALVWYTVWDDESDAARFQAGIGTALSRRSRVGYRAELQALSIEGRPAARYVFAPADWEGWRSLPDARVVDP